MTIVKDIYLQDKSENLFQNIEPRALVAIRHRGELVQVNSYHCVKLLGNESSLCLMEACCLQNMKRCL